MFERISNFLKRRTVTIEGLGTMRLFSSASSWYWLGHLSSLLGNGGKVDLIIHVKKREESLSYQASLVRDFLKEYDSIAIMLYSHIKNSLERKNDPITIEELKKTYVLSSIGLQDDNMEWWIVFEPAVDVDRYYDFIPRFSVRGRTIIWSNLQ